jgi:hypothetical protein
VRRDTGGWGFEPYRMYWKDSYTSSDRYMADAIPTTDPKDFQFELKTDPIPEFTWHKIGDFYNSVFKMPPYQLCEVHMPYYALLRILREDLNRNPKYHRLVS